MAKAVKSSPKASVKKAAKPAVTKKKPVPAAKKKPVASVKTVAKKAIPQKATGKKSAAIKPKNAAKKPVGKKGSKDMTRYRCTLCGYIYSPLRGEPHNGIPEGTAFEDLPEDYICPVCGQRGKGRIGKWGFEAWRPTRYLCSLCSYIYDEKRGEPHHCDPCLYQAKFRLYRLFEFSY